MNKTDVILRILGEKLSLPTNKMHGLAFAPTNIALCKYWGKRNIELNLPVTSSISIALPDKGSLTSLSLIDQDQDEISLNGKKQDLDSTFSQYIIQYLDLFRQKNKWAVDVDIKMNIPVAAGLASSACGFAALAAALNDLFHWQLSQRELSILARLGSGSAARSFWNGFVEWHAGISSDGMDSYGEPIEREWPDLCIGILYINENKKPISSRKAMQQTVDTSMLYQNWPKKVTQDMTFIKKAIKTKNFKLLAGTAESNALSMHATMLAAWPPICYFQPETIEEMQTVWAMRESGIDVYFTEDAGPNLKLLFLQRDKEEVERVFHGIEVIKPFAF